MTSALSLLLGFIVGTATYHWSKKKRAQRENARLHRRIQKVERELSYVMATYPPEDWPTYLTLVRRDLRDVLDLPAYDGNPSESRPGH